MRKEKINIKEVKKIKMTMQGENIFISIEYDKKKYNGYAYLVRRV